MSFSSNKKSDVGLKFAQGIISTDDTNIAWYTEKYGLSPNQLADDIWLRDVPVAAGITDADTNHTNNSFITKHVPNSVLAGGVGYVKLVKETASQGGGTQNHNNTLFMARGNTGAHEGQASGPRLRNFLNPNNHFDNNVAISSGYTIKLYESVTSNSTSSSFPNSFYDFTNNAVPTTTGEYVTLNTTVVPNNLDDLSFSFWVKFDDVSRPIVLVSKNDSSGGNTFIFGLWPDGAAYKWTSFLWLGNSSTAVTARLGSTPNTGQWYHVVSTYEVSGTSGANTKNIIYLNGVKIAEGTIMSAKFSDINYYNQGRDWSLGMEWDNNNVSDKFDGQMSEVSIFSTNLSLAQVQAIYNNGDGLDLSTSNSGSPHANLEAYYKFDEGSGTSLADSSSNSHTGTISVSDNSNWETNTPPGPDLTKQIAESGAWVFYYKEGILVWSNDSTDQSVLSSFNTDGGKYLWAILYQYTGPTYLPTGTPSNGNALKYNSSGSGSLEWFDIDHDALTNFVANEHIDWSASQSGNSPAVIHADNYIDTNTQNQYSLNIPSGTKQLTLVGSGHHGATTDYVEFADGGATTVTRTSDSLFTISSTDTNTTYSISAAAGGNGYQEKIVLTDNNSNSTDVTLEVAHGLQISQGSNTITLGVDNKTNGGIVFESGDLAVDLSATSITGTLGVGDGGTGLTSVGSSNQLLAVNGAGNALTYVNSNSVGLTTEEIQDLVGPFIDTGGTKTRISITYQDTTDDIDFVVDDDLSHYDNTHSGFLTAHPNITNSSANVVNTGQDFIQSIVMDSNGHVTGITSATATGGSGGTTYQAGDGIQIDTGTSPDTIKTDLKANGGLVIESTELAVDLGASSITGTLSAGDGGTGLSSYSAGDILYHSGSGTFNKIALGSAGQILKIGTSPPIPMWVDDGSAGITTNRIPKGTGTSITNSNIKIDDQTNSSTIQSLSPSQELNLSTNHISTSTGTTYADMTVGTGDKTGQGNGYANIVSGNVNIKSGLLKGNVTSSNSTNTLTTGNVLIESGLVNVTSTTSLTNATGTLSSGSVAINAGSVNSTAGNPTTQGSVFIGNNTNTVSIGKAASGSNVSLNGDITKIGESTTTNGYFLKWDGSKAVWAAVSGGSGGSEVNDLTGGNVTWDDIPDANVVGDFTNISKITNSNLQIGRDSDNLIKFDVDNQITFRVNAGDGVVMKANGEIEATSLDISGNVDIDGTMEADAITLDTRPVLAAIDEDTLSSNTDQQVPTQQSVKAYVDNNIAAVNQYVAPTANSSANRFPVLFHNSGVLHDDFSGFSFTPSTDTVEIAGDLEVTGDIVSSKITTSAEQSVLAGNLSIGAHDDEDRIYLARYGSLYPEAHIFCGLPNNNVTTGFQVVTKNGSSYQEAFTISGSTRAATFQGNISGLGQLTVTNNINANSDLTVTGNITANGNISGDGSTRVNSIDDIQANKFDAVKRVSSVVRSTGIGTGISDHGGICEVITEGTIYSGSALTQNHIYQLTQDSNGDPSWVAADASTAGKATGILAVALGTTPSHGMLTKGWVVINKNVLGNLQSGRTLFLKTSPGFMDGTAPSGTGEIQRILGHYYMQAQGTLHSVINFNPSQEFITIA